MAKPTFSYRVFEAVNYFFLTVLTLMCLAPVIHMAALSFSSNFYAVSGQVTLWPKGFTLNSYRYLIKETKFWTALLVTLKRLALGVTLNMSLCVLTAYPLSKEVDAFRARTAYVWFFAITMFFGGGLIPTFIVVNMTGLIDKIWALVLPGALSVWYVVLMLNFFRNIPHELEEAALIDGASHVQTLIRIFLPVSLPSLATVLLFVSVGHWNDWFSGFIYMNSPKNYPLQTYLATLVLQAQVDSKKVFIDPEELARLANISQKTLRIAQIFMGAIPIMLVYPFLQRFFIKGIVVGSVKG